MGGHSNEETRSPPSTGSTQRNYATVPQLCPPGEKRRQCNAGTQQTARGDQSSERPSEADRLHRHSAGGSTVNAFLAQNRRPLWERVQLDVDRVTETQKYAGLTEREK